MDWADKNSKTPKFQNKRAIIMKVTKNVCPAHKIT